jgi:hypothetical protein
MSLERTGTTTNAAKLLGSLAAGWLAGGTIVVFAVGLPALILSKMVRGPLFTGTAETDGFILGAVVGLVLCGIVGSAFGGWSAPAWTFAVGPPLGWLLIVPQMARSGASPMDAFGFWGLATWGLATLVFTLGFWLGRARLRAATGEAGESEGSPHRTSAST